MAKTQKIINIFYSYAHQDTGLWDELNKHLEALRKPEQIQNWHGYEISQGEERKQEIIDFLGIADIILLLMSPDFLASEFCSSVEIERAIQRHIAGDARVIPIFPHSIAGYEDTSFSKLPPLPANAQSVTSWSNCNEVFADIVEGIREATEEVLERQENASQGEETLSDSSRSRFLAEKPQRWLGSPFPGLRAFKPEDESIFFGREQETKLLEKWLTEPTRKSVCVVGASGSGKSSLVGAGLLPRLIRRGWTWAYFTPGSIANNPFIALASGLISIPAIERRYRQSHVLAAVLQHISPELDEVFSLALPDDQLSPGLLLFVDQLEELFTITPEHYRLPFISLLDHMAQMNRVHLVATLRADFYHRCVEIPRLAALLRPGTFPLAAPEFDVFLEMITRPATYAGLVFEEGLPGRILKDTGDNPGALALMAYLLDGLYKKRDGNNLSIAAYVCLGGVQGAIGKQAEEAFENFSQSEFKMLETEEAKKKAAETFFYVFRDLVEVSEGGVATRQRALLKQITRGDEDSPSAKLVEALTKARLLVSSHDLVLSHNEESGPVVEIAHEAMLGNWPRLKQWIESKQEDLILLRQVKQAAKDWERHGKNRDFLWQHERLVFVRAMLARLNNPNLDEVAQEFIRPEQEWLLDEINDINTSHNRRNSIGQRLAELGDPRRGIGLREDGLPDIIWLPVEGGQVRVGDAGMFKVNSFYISKYLVTHAQFNAFIESGGYENERWWEGLRREIKSLSPQQSLFDNHPRDSLPWEDAMAFCRWLNAQFATVPQRLLIGADWQIRLPTEWEWQQAATSGNPFNTYPWGAQWDYRKANTLDARLSTTTAVGMYPHGVASCGALDMCGNICEWCLNEYHNISSVDISNNNERVRRGGSCNHPHEMARNDYRYDFYSFQARYQLKHDFGFRVVWAPPV